MNSRDAQKKFEKRMFAVSQYLKELRYSENLTQAEISTETGLHRNTISNIERSNSNNCNILTLLQLCEFYQISASELFSIID